MAGQKKSATTHAGFTLLELLVVMLIVVVAIAVLYPVFMQVREKGRQSVCLSQVSQHARAVLMYAQDHDDRLPVAWNRLEADADETLYPQWWNAVDPYLKNQGVFHCPDDSGYMSMRPGDPYDNRPFFDGSGSSYSSFLGWLPTSDTSLTGPMPRLPGGLGGLSLAAIMDPSRTANSYDAWPFWHAYTRDLLLAANTDGVLLNVSFLDGSARRRSSRFMTVYLAQGPDAAEELRLLAARERFSGTSGGGEVRPAGSKGTDVPPPDSGGQDRRPPPPNNSSGGNRLGSGGDP